MSCSLYSFYRHRHLYIFIPSQDSHSISSHNLTFCMCILFWTRVARFQTEEMNIGRCCGSSFTSSDLPPLQKGYDWNMTNMSNPQCIAAPGKSSRSTFLNTMFLCICSLCFSWVWVFQIRCRLSQSYCPPVSYRRDPDEQAPTPLQWGCPLCCRVEEVRGFILFLRWRSL